LGEHKLNFIIFGFFDIFIIKMKYETRNN